MHIPGLLLLHLAEGNGRSPVLAQPGTAHLAVQLIHLLKGKTLGLVDQKVHERDAQEAAAAPDEEDLGLQVGVARAVVDQIRGGVGDGPVEQPVGGGGHGEGLGADLEGEDFASHDPGAGAPGGGEEEDVEADEGDGGLLGGFVVDDDDAVGVLAGGGGADNGDDELRDAHAHGTPEEDGAATPFFDGVEARQGGADVDAVGDETDGEGVLEAGVLEELGAIVENEVDAGELLQGLQAAASQEPLEQVALEAVEVGGFAKTKLILVVGLDLGQFLADGRVIGREAAETAEGSGGAIDVAPLDQVPGRVREDQHTADENDRPGKLDRDGDAVAAGVHAVLRGVVDDRGQQETDGDGELVGTDDRASDPLGGRFRLVQRDCPLVESGNAVGERRHTQRRDQTDPETGKEATRKEEGDPRGGRLQDDSQIEHLGRSNQTPATTDPVTHGSSTQSTEEGTSREDGDDGGRLRGGNIGVSGGVTVAGGEELLPVGHGKNAADCSCVISRSVRRRSLQERKWRVVRTYPKRTPPKATKRPMTMAGQDFPGTPSGFLSISPMVQVLICAD
jgi:hypothetical protein